MDDGSGTFVAVRRLSQGLDRSNGYHSSSAEVAGSNAWIGRGLSCVCAQRRESDARLSFDLTPYQTIFRPVEHLHVKKSKNYDYEKDIIADRSSGCHRSQY